MNIKDSILNAAIQIFSERGFEGVSIREIADKADIHFSSIRYHFGNKNELYKACISKHGSERLKSAKKFLRLSPKSKEDMRIRLGLAINDIFIMHGQNPSLTKLILLEIESSSHRTDRELKKTMVAMTKIFATFFKQCQHKSFLKKNLDPLFLTQSLMGIIHHLIKTEHRRERFFGQRALKNQANTDQLVENILELFLGEN